MKRLYYCDYSIVATLFLFFVLFLFFESVIGISMLLLLLLYCCADQKCR